MSARSSQASEAWMPDSPQPDTGMSSSARATRGAAKSSPPDGPECPSTTTYVLWNHHRTHNHPGECIPGYTPSTEYAVALNAATPPHLLTSSVEGSPAKTC